MTICTWHIITNRREIDITGQGTPQIVAANTRCADYNSGFQLLKLSGEVDGYCAYPDEAIVSSTSICTQKYDCLNGGCVTKETYSTPGLYASLEACQSICGVPPTPPCDGECVSNAQIAALQQAANIITSKLCG